MYCVFGREVTMMRIIGTNMIMMRMMIMMMMMLMIMLMMIMMMMMLLTSWDDGCHKEKLIYLQFT